MECRGGFGRETTEMMQTLLNKTQKMMQNTALPVAA